MIIKARSIGHIDASLEYILKEEKEHQILSSDGLDISDTRTMMNDFELFQKNSVKNGYVSVVISPNKKDELSDKDYNIILQETLKELKLDNRQYIAVTHNNTEHKHIHVILNRIDYQDQTWNDHHVAWKCQTACKNICNTLGLHTAYENENKQKVTISNDYDELREGIRQELKSILKREIYNAESLGELHKNIEERGVKVHIEQFKNGLFGTSFEFKGMKYKASKVDRKLSVTRDGNTYIAKPQLQNIFKQNAREKLVPNTRDFEKRLNSIEDTDELAAYMKNQASKYASYTSGLSGSTGKAMKHHRNQEDVESDEEKRKEKRKAKEKGRGMI